MKVEQLMTKEVHTCQPGDTLSQAAGQLWDGDCGALPVVDGSARRVVGMITDRDICMAAYFKDRPLSRIPVESVMTRVVRSCHPGDDLAEAEKTMQSAQVRRLPVVDGADQLLGVISLADVAQGAMRSGRQRGVCTESEVAETLGSIVKPHHELVATS